jgi:hypothetical protein
MGQVESHVLELHAGKTDLVTRPKWCSNGRLV